jgi:hypothetical protein
MQMENMPASQLFRRIIRLRRRSPIPRRRRTSINRNHILSTNNAAPTSQSINLFLRRIRISCIHIPRCTTIFDEIEALA